MKKNSDRIVVEEEEFDELVWQKAQIKNNSGYLDEEYEMTPQFPNIPDYHFRIEDDQAILELQKCSLNDTPLQPVNFDKASTKFHNKLQGLLEGLCNAQSKTLTNENKSPNLTEKHGFYSLDKDYDDEAAIKQAFSRIQSSEVQEKMKQLSLQENKPKFIKKPKNANKIQNEGAGPVNNLSKQFNKLSINEEDL